MSKKKAATTMSLKDFHGGSIPSDLPLPSAPEVMKPSSGSSMSSKGNNLVNSDLRPRLKSSGARDLDHKSSLLSHPLPIGRHFDEDERMPLNGVSPSPSIHQEMRPSSVSSMRVYDSQVSSPSLVNSNSSTLRKEGSSPFVINSRTQIGSNDHGINNGNRPNVSNGHRVNNSQPNAWGMKKEVVAVEETSKPSLLSGVDALSKISQASALEKVSFGMWQSKKPSQLLPHLKYSGDIVSDDRAEHEVAEYGPRDGGKKSPKLYIDELHAKASSVASLKPPAPSREIPERPKLTLLPRSVLPDTSYKDYRKGYQHPAVAKKGESVNELYGDTDFQKADASAAEVAERPVERLKLNLKPRSQPLDKSDGSLERERQALFGGARPRELVLKERSVDETPITDLNRVNSPKNETTSKRLVPSSQQNHNRPNLAHDKRDWRDSERKEPHLQHKKDDNLGKSRRDHRPEPDTWRKPIEEPKPASQISSGNNQGKAVSALELAQAFSKSISNSKAHEGYPVERRLHGGLNKTPFSRLTDSGEVRSLPTRMGTARHHINGY